MRPQITRLWSTITSMVSRGTIARVDDSTPIQTIQLRIRADELEEAVELLQPYGVSFVPPRDAEVLAFAAGGSQDQMVAALASSRGDRPTDASESEGGLYHLGDFKVFIDKDGLVHLGQRTATQKGVRGEDLRDAMSSYANAVTEAVAQITYAGTGSVSSSTAVQSLSEASLHLVSDINDALSNKVKIE